VGAAAEIGNDLVALAARGVAVVVISEDLAELFELCTELVVLAQGRLSPQVPVGDATGAEIGQWMSGLFPGAPARDEPPPPPSRAPRAPEGTVRGRAVGSSGVGRDTSGAGRSAWFGARPLRSGALAVAAPLAALGLTLVAGAILFAAMGKSPGAALAMFLVEPLRGAGGWRPSARCWMESGRPGRLGGA
jgi:hypothetical protein